MTRDEAADLVRRALREIAPEANLSALPTGADLRAELDLDSMDFLNFLTALHEATGIDVPESEARQLATLEGAVAFLTSRAAAGR